MRFLIFLVAIAVPVFGEGEPERCATDLVFIVDQSSSITPVTYKNQILPFLSNLVEGLAVGQDGDHVAFIPFSDHDVTEVAFKLNEHTDTESVLQAIANHQFNGGNTATVRALELARSNVFTEQNGARKSRYGVNVAPTLLIITDGRASDGNPGQIAERLRADGVAIFAVGVGSLVNEEYLTRITGDKTRVFSVSSYQELTRSLAETIIAKTTQCAHRSGVRRA